MVFGAKMTFPPAFNCIIILDCGVVSAPNMSGESALQSVGAAKLSGGGGGGVAQSIILTPPESACSNLIGVVVAAEYGPAPVPVKTISLFGLATSVLVSRSKRVPPTVRAVPVIADSKEFVAASRKFRRTSVWCWRVL